MYKVIVIEDDVMMSDMLSMYLSEEGYSVKQAGLANDGLRIISEFEPDLVLLDLMLPDMDGMEICALIRERSNVPIMILSMKNEVSERVLALKSGADDYMCKPFSMHEMTARVEALIRRANIKPALAEAEQEPGEEERDPIQLDFERRLLLVRGMLVETTFSEYEIMKLFLAYPGKVFSREELINAIRGFDSFVTDRAIDVHIVNLRKKIEQNPKEPRLIRTVWGFGYKYTAQNTSVSQEK
ncbi:DNA-binding response regulator, OmpR family, contains REC and winged-helix (wHTH) domain [Paenibacillus algorifonticola]|uniref:DNA-binding response regulator, OmpR family, contains REC and winged-helix (WHTH) domain n=1 Tax=Paenibacillus algorifonticola TaxID=684063 RepID=A0A1I2H9F2_9BACL|nr:response regulator transcription factor [Paenibacillus algorifonticola]SFF26855.1 DNA-binding response regulator, OmpR family, contains REC and winged-helix (wHTH) domain [Paenibacillus algorifonticola]